MCGAVHDERTRRRMLRGDRWVAQLEALDEDVISFGLGRLDSARASLAQICREWRRAKRAYLDSMPVRLDGHLKDACRGLSRSLLNFASGGLPVSAPRSSILRHVSNRTVGRGQRVQGADQVA